MIRVIRDECIFEMVTGENMKELEYVKETLYIFTGNIDCNFPVESGAPITVKGKWCAK
jgi:hypothetical protein